MPLQILCILGAGTLGTRVALQAAISGFDVKVFDIKAQALDSSLSLMGRLLKQQAKLGQLNEAQFDEIIGRIQFTLDPAEAIGNADLVCESVTEELEIKKEVWVQFGQLAPEKTWFTTNTSFLLPSSLAEASGRPERFCAFHFHDVFYSRVVDIMPHPGTLPEMVPLLQALGKRLNQVPVLVKKENPGYIFNAMLITVLGAAGKILTNEVASIEDIDRSWMVNFHMPVGPFGIIDSIGLDTAWHVVSRQPGRSSRDFAALLESYIKENKLGEKTGEGFYTYPNPRFRDADFIK